MKGRLLWLLPVVLAAACLAAILLLRHARVPGASAEIRQDGEVIRTVSLSEDAVFTVAAPGGGSNTVEVSGGRIRVSEADCPDKTCVRQGWVSDTGTPIVCLPHGLVISVVGGERYADAAAR